jgi:hypothetical protein
LITAAVLSEKPKESIKNHSTDIGVGVKTVKKAIKDLENFGKIKNNNKIK